MQGLDYGLYLEFCAQSITYTVYDANGTLIYLTFVFDGRQAEKSEWKVPLHVTNV